MRQNVQGQGKQMGRKQAEAMGAEMDTAMQDADIAQEEVYSEMSPQGDFSKAATNGVIKALNSVLPLFGIDKLEMVDSDTTEFSPDLTRSLSMVAQSVSDAMEAGELDDELLFDMEDIGDDRDLKLLSGKLSMLARHKDFKRWLKTAEVEPETADDPAAAKGLASGQDEPDLDALFQARM